MRRTLNENPVAQIAVLAVLAVVIGFLLLTRVANQSGDEPSATSSTASARGPAIDSASSNASDSATGSGEVPSTLAPESEGAAVPPANDAPVGEFVAGPGLPARVVKAYADDKTVVLLVLRRRGIDDDRLRRDVERLRGRSDVALFVTNAGHIARYSRITQGVNVDRVPALIVLRPRQLTQGTPTASLSYGFRGPESVDQAVRDALYKGPRNLPYYPR